MDFPIQPIVDNLFYFGTNHIYGFITDKYGGIVYHPKLSHMDQAVYTYFTIDMIELGKELKDKVLFNFREDKFPKADVKIVSKVLRVGSDNNAAASENYVTYHFRNVSPCFFLD